MKFLTTKNLKLALFSALAVSTMSMASGLDKIHKIVKKDTRLQKKVSQEDIQEALNCADKMNDIIIEAIKVVGAGNDNKITTPEVREMNKYIHANYGEEWKALHGDDEENTETGFHKIVNNGAKIKIFGKNAVNKVFDGIYHLGYSTEYLKRLENEDGNKNVKFSSVASWLTKLLKKDLKSGALRNPSITEVKGETGTKLDKIVNILYKDKNINKFASIGDIRKSSKAANEMNKIIVEAVNNTGALDDGEITKDEVSAINKYIYENYGDVWKDLYNDYISITYARPKTSILNRNAVKRVFKTIYHLGFEPIYPNRLSNINGEKGPNYKIVSLFLNHLIKPKK